MQNRLKKSLVSIILGFTLLSISESCNLYSQEQDLDYLNKTSINYQDSRNDFKKIDLVFVGLTTLGAYYFFKKFRQKQ